jgi:hypothetical protein
MTARLVPPLRIVAGQSHDTVTHYAADQLA